MRLVFGHQRTRYTFLYVQYSMLLHSKVPQRWRMNGVPVQSKLHRKQFPLVEAFESAAPCHSHRSSTNEWCRFDGTRRAHRRANGTTSDRSLQLFQDSHLASPRFMLGLAKCRGRVPTPRFFRIRVETNLPFWRHDNIHNARSRKSAKYTQLLTDIIYTGVKCEKVTPFEVFALGNIPTHARLKRTKNHL